MDFQERPSVDKTMLEVAQTFSRRSTCRRRSVGCVLVDDKGRILSVGFNGVPKGHQHCLNSPCSGAKEETGTALELCEATHAEINALIQCPDTDKIETAYVSAEPCVMCARALANTSCQNVVFAEEYVNSGKKFWNGRGRWEKYIDYITHAYTEGTDDEIMESIKNSDIFSRSPFYNSEAVHYLEPEEMLDLEVPFMQERDYAKVEQQLVILADSLSEVIYGGECGWERVEFSKFVDRCVKLVKSGLRKDK